MEKFTSNTKFKDVLAEPLIAAMTPYTVTNMDFSREKCYDLTFSEMPASGYWNAESMRKGFNRLYEQACTGKWYYPLYTEEEIREDPLKKEASLVYMPSKDPEADKKPYLIVVPGGGYVNVWNLTEGWPIAAHFNELGYHCFVLSYRVDCALVLKKALEDYAKALTFIRDHEKEFGVTWDRYITTGFSAGANLICTWAIQTKGYGAYGLPKPLCMFPIYAPVSWKLMAKTSSRDTFAMNAIGMTVQDAAASDWNIDENVAGYPPCYIACTEEDSMVDPEHSRILKRALDAEGIPAKLHVGPVGDHGFAEGIGTCMEGWIEEAAAFAQENI